MSKKALIIVDHGSAVEEANDTLAQIAALIESSGKSWFDIVKYCHMELAEPTVAQAFDACVREGRNTWLCIPIFWCRAGTRPGIYRGW